MAEILDSGERRQFDTGAVRDIQEGKGRCDLLPLDVISNVFYRLADGVSISPYFEAHNTLFFVNRFTETGCDEYLYDAIRAAKIREDMETLLLEVSKHFEEGAKKYGEHNWQKGIPTHCYIDSAVRHYLKYLRGDKDEPHDRAFVWNILCCIWTCNHKPELNDYSKGVEYVE